MHARLMVGMVLLGLAGFTCDPSTAMAAPRAAPAYAKGHSPHRPMELLEHVTLQVSPALGRDAAIELLRERAAALGADAVVDVVVERVKTVVSAGSLTAVPNLMMGALMSLATWNPDSLLKVTQQELAMPMTRTVLRVHGVPVKFLR